MNEEPLECLRCYSVTLSDEGLLILPELPEVETLRRGLERHLVGRTILRARIPVPKMLKGNVSDPALFDRLLRGRRIDQVGRRGKHLIFSLHVGYYLLLHLKMRGQLLVASCHAPEGKYLTAVLEFDDEHELRFHDIWTWGELRLLTATEYASHPPLRTMGPEPFAEEWTPEILQRSLSQRPRSAIKAALLDQTVVAGVGNIYADESLFRACISPLRPAGALTIHEAATLHHEIRSVLAEATEGGGTTSDNYVDSDGHAGGYSPRVYDRAGMPCMRCQGPLARTKVTGRGTTFCPSCQI